MKKEKENNENTNNNIYIDVDVEGDTNTEVDDDTQVIVEMDNVATLEEKLKDSLDKHQRTLAEFDNFRKRTSKEKSIMYDDGVRDCVEKILPVLDNIERAIATQDGKSEDDDPFLKGVKMTIKQLNEILSSMGIEVIASVGEKFDPNLHAAVAHEDNEEFGENEIILDMLKGYTYKGKVIRHSMVKVAN